MITDVRLPSGDVGLKRSVGRWFKRAGDTVSRDEPLVEINTVDVTDEILAPASGVLTTVLIKDGQSVEPGAVLGQITAF